MICATLLVAALISACGSSSTPVQTHATAGQSGGSSSGGNPSGGTASSKATVVTKTVPGYGTVLATSSGKPLYLLTADPAGSSKCTGSCSSTWPPLTVQGKPTAGSGVSASLLSTFKRSDGKLQVLYNGHALYTYTGPSAASGAGMASYGGIWYLVSPAGKAIKSTASGGY